MGSSRMRGLLGACLAGSLMLSSTAAIAAPAAPQQLDPWGVLAAMSGGAPAAAVCGSAAGAAAAAAQAPVTGCVLPVVDAPPPVPAAQAAPPPLVPAVGPDLSPLLLGLGALAAAVGFYLVLHNNHHPNSPA
jgi:hypothetical protein